MSMSQFDCHKVDYLFLLIGENPLPNYVAAKLLLKPKGILYLVHTGDEKTGTYKQARRLQDVLSKESSNFQSIELISLGEYDSDAFHIQDIIKQYFPNNGQVGLNYTGGTKAMAVHAYRAVFDKYSNNAVFSYLNPRRLEMCIDKEGKDCTPIKITPDLVEVNLLTLFTLHGLKMMQPPIREPQLTQAATKLAEVCSVRGASKAWYDWFYNKYCAQSKLPSQGNKKGNWKPEEILINLAVPTEGLPTNIIKAFEDEKLLDAHRNFSFKEVKESGKFASVTDFCKWLNGEWLEHYVLQQIRSIRKGFEIADYGLNFKVPLAGTRDGFQFDVAFTHGYQLFAISCTTDSDFDYERGLCKSKLFEAYIRAQQMGGSEARVALVCRADAPTTLEAELADILKDQKIRVFGKADLPNLANKISEWIQDANS